MQQIILPDYLDGSKEPKERMLGICLLSKMCDFAELNGINSLSFSQMLIANNPLAEQLQILLPMVQGDLGAQLFIRCYKLYKDTCAKNYIVQRDLVKAFLNTKLDIKASYLPNNFNGYLELKGLKDQDGYDLIGTFVDINPEAIRLSMVSYNKATSFALLYLNMPKDPIKTIHDLIVEQRYSHQKAEKTAEGLKITSNESDTSEYFEYIHAIFNTIVYITRSGEILSEEHNEFSKKASKRAGEMKVYTRKGFVVLGKDFVLPKTYIAGVVNVVGHWRWQPHGPQRSLLKHIYITPHQRNYGGTRHETVRLESTM